MTSFARYHNGNKKLISISMTDIENWIKDESNKIKIADKLFERYYSRYLKVFNYKSNQRNSYLKPEKDKIKKIELEEFTEEFKNGFSMMVNCCLVIEAIASFFEGQNKTQLSGKQTFKIIFQKAKEYDNPISCFEDEPFYSHIRCGLLHQGETYGKFKIVRNGELFRDKTINATLFHKHLIEFLKSYREELKSANWDSDLWDRCRIKLRHIIRNSK